jgi:hypothetical protein
MLARCRSAFLLLCLPFFFTSIGCRNRTDLIEAELRSRDQYLRDSLEQQQRNEAYIISLQRELEAIRKGAKITPEQAAQTFGLKRIVLGRATGGLDHDGVPGDELLQVVVEPRDHDDHSIKAPGSLQVVALEVLPSGVKSPLSQWDIAPEQLRQTWKQGLLSTGYSLTLPWKTFPVTEQIRVVVRFTTADQRVFEADKDIKVRLVPGAPGKRPDLMPEAWPVPHPAPLMESGPILMPTSRMTPAPTPWRPAGEDRSVTVGRPEPIK